MKRLVLGLFFGLSLILIACSSSEPNVGSSVEFSLTATDLAFDTTRFEVTAGQPLKITLHNEGTLTHDFTVQEMPHNGKVMVEEMAGSMEHDMGSMSETPDIHMAASSGNNSSIAFTPSKAGEYPFFCTVAGHKEAGMVGVLIVKAP